jgi:transcriptional activator protein UGA3
MQSHRYLHEAFRISCLLSLSTFVLRTPPSALRVRLLVRQALSLLEQMHDQHLPGYCSSHWVMFVTALSCTPGGIGRDELDDVQRVEQLYDDFE